ncbi:MAG: hypothetical protein K0Q49_1966, partial [Haloplasmataceae bacterium]|nr:hypothetical protein [Haloplasmataceae bacterium]
MIVDNKLIDCLHYFKNTKGLQRALVKIREKYRSLGNLSGNIQLTNLTEEEKEALTGYLKKDCYKKSLSIKVEYFIKALDNTKFADIDFISILNNYFKEEIITKRDEKNGYDDEKLRFFNNLVEKFDHSKAVNWLTYIRDNKDNAYRMITLKYDEDKVSLIEILSYVCDALNIISFSTKKLTRLAVLASTVTKDPHYFDDNTLQNKLLIYSLTYYLNIPYPDNAERTTELLYQAGIIKDEVSNFTLCSGLKAFDEYGRHEGWNGFYESGEPLQISLLNLSKIKSVTSPTKKVFVFENATVFTEVFDKTKCIKAPLMCTFGNVKLASLILLDKLVESDVIIYYSGDFDPEGLLIADKLKSRYQENLVLWGYNKDNYLNNLSNQNISQARVNKLNNIKS